MFVLILNMAAANCCWPPQLTIDQAAWDQKEHRRMADKVAYDWTNKRIRADFAHHGDVGELTTIIARFDLGVVYTIQWEGKKCSVRHLEPDQNMTEFCVPEEAKLDAHVSMGDNWKCDVYVSKEPPFEGIFASHDCVPVSMLEEGPEHSLIHTAFFNGVKTVDQSKFTPPAFCKSAESSKPQDAIEIAPGFFL